ncbi:DNA polymerase IV [Microbacterium sp. RU33B]|uniref:DNA polymerase IV n=1 Tax=Microbacterium sp. RU33B TaxID=1907390 RepID=UPI000968643B|nr:DNA polymerase IV [Microbacterium sp. RU33B]SIT73417.1 DNA polymerase-4 [Microbacterium sp. RU33B]
MGRGDGTGRLVSAIGADDTGTGILHVDMDAFFAAVAILDDPSLKGKPIIVGGPADGRGVVSSASYEARRFGVRSAMPVSQALRLCPTAIIVTSSYDRYIEESEKVMAIFREYTPLVEPLSIDEAFLDVRGARRLWGTPGQIAVQLRERVLEQTGLTCSIGVAATKHVAKMASTISKPDGLLIVSEAATAAFLRDRPVRALWGVGPKTAESLEGRGIHSVADILDTPRPVLDRVLGPAMSERLWHLARGLDAREVHTERIEKSIGHEETFHTDISDVAVLRSELRRLSDRVGARLRRHGWEASTIAIKVRFSDFSTISRSQTLPEPTGVSQRIGDAAHDLFESIDRHLPIRLVGVRGEKLRPAGDAPPSLWDDDEEWRRVEGALDDATARFGKGAVTRATLLGPSRGGGTLPSNPRPSHRE